MVLVHDEPLKQREDRIQQWKVDGVEMNMKFKGYSPMEATPGKLAFELRRQFGALHGPIHFKRVRAAEWFSVVVDFHNTDRFGHLLGQSLKYIVTRTSSLISDIQTSFLNHRDN